MNKHFGSNYIIFGWDAGKWFKQQVSRKKIHSPFQQAENSPKAHRFRGGGNEPAMTSALNDAHLSRSPCLSFWIFFFFNSDCELVLCSTAGLPWREFHAHILQSKTGYRKFPEFPETEYLWISLHLKISKFPPNDNMKLSYDMIF